MVPDLGSLCGGLVVRVRRVCSVTGPVRPSDLNPGPVPTYQDDPFGGGGMVDPTNVTSKPRPLYNDG